MKKKKQKELLNIVKDNYEKIAEGFSQTREKRLWPELLELLKDVRDGDRVLDVGCGNGRLARAFDDKKVEFVGIDLSHNLIKIAQEKHPEHKFSQGDILNLGVLPDYDFDYVTCIAVLPHVPGQDLQIQALKQLKNKIKKDGKIILTAWNLWENKKYNKMVWKFFFLKLFGKNKMEFGDILFDWKKDKDVFVSKRYYHAFRVKELKKIVKKSGLNIEKFYRDKYNLYLVLTK